MGTQVEAGARAPFMAALDQVALNYEHAARYLTRQEELPIKTVNKAIERLTFLDRETSALYV
jgi:hypothetical protein